MIVLEQVSARWHPEDGQRPDIQDAPVFRPTEEVFILFFLPLIKSSFLRAVQKGSSFMEIQISELIWYLISGVQRYFEIYSEHTPKS